jgi:hypothetical protein
MASLRTARGSLGTPVGQKNNQIPDFLGCVHPA